MKIRSRKENGYIISLYRIFGKNIYVIESETNKNQEIINFAPRTPISVHINATNKCNMSCSYCYTEGSYDEKSCYMKMDDYINLLNLLNSNEIFKITWSGGEPYMNKDFNDILSHSLSLNFVNIILTNLKNIKLIDIDTLKNKNVQVQAGLNGIWSDNRVFNKELTVIAENYKILVDKGINIRGTLMIDQEKIDIKKLLDYLDKNNMHKIRIGLLINMGRAKGVINLDEYRKYVRRVTDEIASHRHDYKNLEIVLQSEFEAYNENIFCRRYCLCEAGVTEIYISANGDVYPCPLLQDHDLFYSGNILRDKYKDILESVAIKKTREIKLGPKCEKCKNFCGVWCRGLTYSYTKKLEGQSPFCLFQD